MGTRTRHGGPCNAGACRWDTYASLHRRTGPRTLSLPAPQLGGLGWEYVLVHNGGAGTAKPERRRRRPAARRLRGGRSWGTVFVDGIKKGENNSRGDNGSMQTAEVVECGGLASTSGRIGKCHAFSN
jgi:hypothetical protein